MPFHLDHAIASWRSSLEFNPRFLREDVDELEQHIRDQVNGLLLHGKEEKEAFEQAIADMGHPFLMEREYAKVFWGKIRRKGTFVKTFIHEMNMWKSYFKLAWRNLLKNKLASFVNMVGLSTAIGCCIVAFLFTDLFYARDSFHENAENIFLVRHTIEAGNGKTELWGDSPAPLGPALQDDFTQVERAVRIQSGNGYVLYEDNVFEENLRFVDPGFLEMFTFPLKYGLTTSISENNAVVMSEALALKYFGPVNPIGEQISIRFNDTTMVSYLVQGVAEKLPDKASFSFDLLVPFENLQSLELQDIEDWTQLVTATFIQLNNPNAVTSIEAGMERYRTHQNTVSPERPILDFVCVPLPDMAKTAHNVRHRLSFLATNPGQVVYTLVTGLFLLFLSCFNYINIAVTSASHRLKEIGIRKVVGSTRTQLITQFLSENLLLCFLAMMFGILIAETILAPGFNRLFGVFNLHLEYSSAITWYFLVGLLLLTGVGSGAYPAYIISRFQPDTIFRGRQKISRKNTLSGVLLTFQFTLAFITLFSSIVFLQVNLYLQQRSWGYDEDRLLVVPLSGNDQYQRLKDVVERHPGVELVAGTSSHIGASYGKAVIEHFEKEYAVSHFEVGIDYVETMGLNLLDGRSFDRVYGTDMDRAVLINEQFLRTLGWENALEKRIRYNEVEYEVVGVLEDFHYLNLGDSIDPAFLRLSPEDDYSYLVVRAYDQAGYQVRDFLNETWRDLFPDSPFEGYGQETVFEEFLRNMVGLMKMSIAIGLITLIITCMGLLGLVSLNIVRRTKEISIRKVLGAGIYHVVEIINRELIVVLVIGTVVGTPFCYWAFQSFLDYLFPYHQNLNVLPFLVVVVIIFVTTVMTIAVQVYRAATRNPVKALRMD